jgi:hypothetical protein
MKMKKSLVEKGTVVVLFILVLVVFSFAERDSKKLVDLYTRKSTVQKPLVNTVDSYTAESAEIRLVPQKNTRN